MIEKIILVFLQLIKHSLLISLLGIGTLAWIAPRWLNVVFMHSKNEKGGLERLCWVGNDGDILTLSYLWPRSDYEFKKPISGTYFLNTVRFEIQDLFVLNGEVRRINIWVSMKLLALGGVFCGTFGYVLVWLRIHGKPHKGCLHCRYDLRGNVSGVCPECGTQISPSQAIPGVNSVSINPVTDRETTVDSP